MASSAWSTKKRKKDGIGFFKGSLLTLAFSAVAAAGAGMAVAQKRAGDHLATQGYTDIDTSLTRIAPRGKCGPYWLFGNAFAATNAQGGVEKKFVCQKFSGRSFKIV